MSEEFNEAANAHVNRDQAGVVRDVLHVAGPYVAAARTPQLAAQEYLGQFRELFGFSPDELRSLSLAPAGRPEQVGVEYRFLTEKTQFDTTIVTFSQTVLGLPVWEAGLSVQIRQNPFRVISAHSTAHADVRVAVPSEAAVDRLMGLDEESLARSLGLSDHEERHDRASLSIERRELYVYRYEAGQRVREPDHFATPSDPEPRHSHQNPPLPAVPDEIVDGEHYVVAAIYFTLSTPDIPGLRWVALVEAETQAVLMLRAFVASVQGLVFTQDPMTTNGGPPPSALQTALDPLRSSVLLADLDPPAGGTYAQLGALREIGRAHLRTPLTQ